MTEEKSAEQAKCAAPRITSNALACTPRHFVTPRLLSDELCLVDLGSERAHGLGLSIRDEDELQRRSVGRGERVHDEEAATVDLQNVSLLHVSQRRLTQSGRL